MLTHDVWSEGPSGFDHDYQSDFGVARTGDQTSLKRTRVPTGASDDSNPSHAERQGQRRRVDDQNTAAPPTTLGVAVGALDVDGANIPDPLTGLHGQQNGADDTQVCF
jgi:hypothetical protein